MEPPKADAAGPGAAEPMDAGDDVLGDAMALDNNDEEQDAAARAMYDVSRLPLSGLCGPLAHACAPMQSPDHLHA
jgi:hypothetical protein